MTRADRDELIVEHVAFARAVALRYAARLPHYVDSDDLVQEAMIGLIQAAAHYTGETPFRSFAYLRICGQIIDHLRTNEPEPRRVRALRVRYHEAVDRLHVSLDRFPTELEVAADLGLPIAALRRLRIEIARTQHALSLDDVVSVRTREVTIADTLGVRDVALAVLENADDGQRVAHAIAALPQKQRFVVQQRLAGARYRQTASELGVTEPRVSQIFTAACARLRSVLRDVTEAASPVGNE